MDSTVPSSPPTYLCFYQVTCNVHDLIVPEYNMQKRINFFENPKSIFKYPKLYLSILTDSSFVILETLQQKSNSSIKGKKTVSC